MRKISALCIIAILISLLCPLTNATEMKYTDEILNYSYEFLNQNGENITVKIYKDTEQVKTLVYLDEELAQATECDLTTGDMLTTIYNGNRAEVISENLENLDISEMITESDKIFVDPEEQQSDSAVLSEAVVADTTEALVNEPRDNTGLTESGYNDGYYYIGSTSYTYSTARGYLYRHLSGAEYLGLTRYYNWNAGTTLSAIITAVTVLYAARVAEALAAILEFTASETLAYAQSAKVQTYEYHYQYSTRVNDGSYGNYEIYYTTSRSKVYQKIYNITNGEEIFVYDYLSGGFSGSNNEIIKAGIDNYLYYHFSDIWKHWSKEKVKWAYESGLIYGTTPSKFSPDTVMTRASFITVLYRLYQNTDGSEVYWGYANRFTDVSSSSYYYDAVNWAVGAGITNGTSSTTFSPGQAISREQIITFLYRYAIYMGYATTNNGDYSSYPDGSDVGNSAKSAMNWAIYYGVIHGDGGCLYPKRTATRAEGVTFVYNFCDVYGL